MPYAVLVGFLKDTFTIMAAFGRIMGEMAV